MDACDKIYFYANYDKLGELQTSKISEEVVCIQGEVSKVKNGLVFFTLENETGERKVTITKLNEFRDFGTSVYGVFDHELNKKEVLESIIEVIEHRIVESNNTITKLIGQLNVC